MLEKKRIESLKKEISKNRIDVVIKELLEISKNNKGVQEEMLMISAAHEKNKSEFRQGIEEKSKLNIEQAKIVKSILEIIDLLEKGKNNSPQKKSENYFKIVITLFFWIIFISTLFFGLFYFYHRMDIITEFLSGTNGVDISLLLFPSVLIFISLIVYLKKIKNA